MILVIGSFHLPVASRAAAQSAMAQVIAASLMENGCISYTFGEDVLDPGLYRVSESWESMEELAAHFDTPHMAAWKLERAELGMTERNITAYEGEMTDLP
jgi:quinol monooxygenase YgiN